MTRPTALPRRGGFVAFAFAAYAIVCELALFGCSTEPADPAAPGPEAEGPTVSPERVEAEPLPLVAPELWRVASDADDPMRASRPGARLCSDGDMRVEGGGVEVSTASCNHASIAQPSLRPVRAGDVVALRVWWGVLDADAPARGELAVFFDGELVWQDSVSIPGRPDTRDLSFASGRDYPAGAPIVFHVHNHGSNRWTVGEISVRKGD